MAELNNLCPICLKHRKKFERHHVIWTTDGGSSDITNLLFICKTCHIILTRGYEDSYWYDLACVSHQKIVHGLEFEKRAYKDESKGAYSTFLDYKASDCKALNKVTEQEFEQMIKNNAQLEYEVSMCVVHGIITSDEISDCIEDTNKILELINKVKGYKLPNGHLDCNRLLQPTPLTPTHGELC